MKLVFLIFRDNSFDLNQIDNLRSSSFNTLKIASESLCEKNTLVSSANKILDSLSETLGRSLIYIKNSKGPRIEPCGTPQTMGRKGEFHCMIQTAVCLAGNW